MPEMHDVLIYSSRLYDEYRRPDGTVYQEPRSPLSNGYASREATRIARRLQEREYKTMTRKHRSMGE